VKGNILYASIVAMLAMAKSCSGNKHECLIENVKSEDDERYACPEERSTCLPSTSRKEVAL